MRDFASESFEKIFPGLGETLENVLYEYVKTATYKNGAFGMDFYPFRSCYKSKLQSILENITREDSSLYKILSNKGPSSIDEIKDIISKPSKEWEEILWGLDEIISTDENTELREGTFDCSNCARRGLYSRNTVHQEAQTRSADEAMTIFVTCLSCHKVYKFSA